jgi:hypothetical protein
MQSGVRRHAANALTLLRVALAPALACAVVAADRGATGWWAALLFAVAAGSDAADGHLARRLGTASGAGRAFDHGADILFLLAALGTYAGLGVIPWWVPAAVAASFGLYVVDARWPPPAPPRWRADRVGHLGGIANWVLVGVLVGDRSVGLAWLPPPLVLALCAAVPLYSAAAIGGRLAARR